MKHSSVIDGRTFKTKKDLGEHTAKVLQSLHPFALVSTEHKHWPFLKALLERHPGYLEKTGGSIKMIRVKQSASASNGTDMHVMGADDKWVDISWRTAVSGIRGSDKARVLEAMRWAVRPQVETYRMSVPNRCAGCQALSPSSELEVDHYPRPFAAIAADVLNEWERLGYPPLDESGQGARFADPRSAAVSSWTIRHYAEAKYRLLCKPCHKVASAPRAVVEGVPHTKLTIKGNYMTELLKDDDHPKWLLSYERTEKPPFIVMQPLDEPEGCRTVHMIMARDEA